MFLLNFSVIFLVTFLLSGIISYYALKDIELNYFKNQLLRLLNLSEQQLVHIDNLVDFANEFYAATNISIAIIDSNGTVITSNGQKNEEKIKILDSYPELKDAKDNNIGISIRHDEATSKELLHVVKKSSFKGEEIFIKLSYNIKDVMNDTYSLWIRLLFVFSISLLIGLVLAHIMNKSISNEISKITSFLSALAEKKYKEDLKLTFTKEFVLISEMLKKLAKRLEKREIKLKKQTAMLRLKNRQNSEIISAISHEFKNPVAIIVGYSETLINDKNINENIRNRFLGKIASNAKKISNLIDRLTIFIKLENETLEVKKTLFNIYEVCKDVQNMMQEKYKDRKVEIYGQTRFIEADRHLLELVLVNLVDNALKYSEDKVIINITDHAIEVIDYGIGIAPEDIELVTKKFYRVDSNKWNNSLGLGLSIVKYILKLHNSELHIESRLNEGSKFWFEI